MLLKLATALLVALSPGVCNHCNLFHPGGNMLLRFAIAILGVIGLLPGSTLAQTGPLVGSWNFTVTVTGGCLTN